MKKKERISVPAIGGSSLLVVFAVLCLTVFSLLSLSSVLAEKRMADAAAQAMIDYYEADLEAEAIFACLRTGETVSGVEIDGNTYRYGCSITENQILNVELVKNTDGWTVKRWQVIAQSEPINEALPVWDGA